MGVLIKSLGERNDMKKSFSDKINKNKESENNAGLYKSIEQFGWKDATKREMKDLRIDAYKEFSF